MLLTDAGLLTKMGENTPIDWNVVVKSGGVPLKGPDERGLSYKLDLQEGSELRTPSPNRQARSLPMCVHSYGYFVAGPEHFTDRNQMRCLYQVFLTHKGQGRFILGEREYLVGSDTIVLLDCGKPHRYESLGGVWEHEWVNFTGSACDLYYSLINPDGFAIYQLDGNTQIKLIMRELRDGIMNQDMMGFVHSTTRLVHLMDAIYSMTVEQQRIRMADQRGNIARAAKFIDEHYMDKLTLEQVAGVAYLSKYYFTRAFKKYIGMTPYEYLNTVRISHAQHLLITSELSVDDIGWRIGFSGSKNLIRQFKLATGMTPGTYRKVAGGWDPGDGR